MGAQRSSMISSVRPLFFRSGFCLITSAARVLEMQDSLLG
jgi:hypothetical protein